MVPAQRGEPVDRQRPDVDVGELGEGAVRVVERRVDRRAGKRARQRQHDPLGAAALGQVVVDKRDFHRRRHIRVTRVPGRDPLARPRAADPPRLRVRRVPDRRRRRRRGRHLGDVRARAPLPRPLRRRKGEAAAWLIGIARRLHQRALRRAASARGGGARQVAPGELAVDSATRLDLRRAVTALGERDRELIALRYGADLTARQIGELLGMRTNAVEVALHRALQTLREAARAAGCAEPRTEPHGLRAAE